jgi:NADH-quinone oxidoreductase subunit C
MSAEPLIETIASVLDASAGTTTEVVESNGHAIALVPAARWVAALTAARDDLGANFFDWLTGVDELEDGFTVAAHVCASTASKHLRRGQGLLLKTLVPRDEAILASATPVYQGANWHERETYEMFGIEFTGHPDLKPLLLPDGFEGHPLRKQFILASRVAKAWPGAKEPGESDHTAAPTAPGRTAPGRRRMLPPGVPGDDWLKPYVPPAAPDAAILDDTAPGDTASDSTASDDTAPNGGGAA